MTKNELIKLKEGIIFVTSNQGKVASAQRHFTDIKLEIYKYDLIEPRTDDIREIAEFKVRQAYQMVQKPCIALDAGFFIDALNGFPRAFVNFTLDTLGIEGILKQMQGIENRNCAFKECLAYYDGENLMYFDGNHEGTLSTEIRGIDNEQKWSDLWYIFMPYGYDKTLAELTNEERNKRARCPQNTGAMEEFVDYYHMTKKLTK